MIVEWLFILREDACNDNTRMEIMERTEDYLEVIGTLKRDVEGAAVVVVVVVVVVAVAGRLAVNIVEGVRQVRIRSRNCLAHLCLARTKPPPSESAERCAGIV